MLKSLKVHGVGPVRDLSAFFGERLNIFTGDNGLGKSFLLDVCFWCLTGSWPGGRIAMPDRAFKSPNIHFELLSKTKTVSKEGAYDFKTQTWSRQRGRPPMSGLVVYAAVDGGFSVWDPARNYWRDAAGEQWPQSFHFNPEPTIEEEDSTGVTRRGDVANGLEEGGKVLCKGLIDDWVEWFYLKATKPRVNPFSYLEGVIDLLSHPLEPLKCEEPRRVFLDDTRKFPTLRMPYGVVPYPQWSAGVKRIISFAYLIVWAWVEHLEAAELRKDSPTDRVVLIVDEIESHLHPKWQRTILPAVLKVIQSFQADTTLQVFTATHSPLVLASLEPFFVEEKDRLFWFDLQKQVVHFEEFPWAIQGDVVGWLTSRIFGLKQARSKEAEVAIEAAEAFMRGDKGALPAGLKSKERIHDALLKYLPGMDPFWPRWIVEAKP